MTHAAYRTGRQRGFTIVELVVVVIVIVVLAAVAIPGISRWIEEYRLGIAAHQVADALQTAKMQAVAKTRRTELLFDVAGNRLGLQGATLVPLPPGVRFAAPDTVTPPDEGVAMGDAVTFPAVGESSGLRTAAFTGRGLPDADPGESFAVFLANSTGSSAVVMSSAGNIRIWTWDAGAWK